MNDYNTRHVNMSVISDRNRVLQFRIVNIHTRLQLYHTYLDLSNYTYRCKDWIRENTIKLNIRVYFHDSIVILNISNESNESIPKWTKLI